MNGGTQRRTLAPATASLLYLASGLALASDPGRLDGWAIRLAGVELRLMHLVGSPPPGEWVAAAWAVIGIACGMLALRSGRGPRRGARSPNPGTVLLEGPTMMG